MTPSDAMDKLTRSAGDGRTSPHTPDVIIFYTPTRTTDRTCMTLQVIVLRKKKILISLIPV